MLQCKAWGVACRENKSQAVQAVNISTQANKQGGADRARHRPQQSGKQFQNAIAGSAGSQFQNAIAGSAGRQFQNGVAGIAGSLFQQIGNHNYAYLWDFQCNQPPPRLPVACCLHGHIHGDVLQNLNHSPMAAVCLNQMQTIQSCGFRIPCHIPEHTKTLQSAVDQTKMCP